MKIDIASLTEVKKLFMIRYSNEGRTFLDCTDVTSQINDLILKNVDDSNFTPNLKKFNADVCVLVIYKSNGIDYVFYDRTITPIALPSKYNGLYIFPISYVKEFVSRFVNFYLWKNKSQDSLIPFFDVIDKEIAVRVIKVKNNGMSFDGVVLSESGENHNVFLPKYEGKHIEFQVLNQSEFLLNNAEVYIVRVIRFKPAMVFINGRIIHDVSRISFQSYPSY